MAEKTERGDRETYINTVYYLINVLQITYYSLLNLLNKYGITHFHSFIAFLILVNLTSLCI